MLNFQTAVRTDQSSDSPCEQSERLLYQSDCSDHSGLYDRSPFLGQKSEEPGFDKCLWRVLNFKLHGAETATQQF